MYSLDMSAARSQITEYGYAGLRMSAEDFFGLGEAQERFELIDGVVLMSPSPRPRHAKVIQEILKQLGRFEDAGGSVDIYIETDLHIDDFSVFRPDICAYATKPPERIPDRLTAPPGLVVEVLSPGTEALDLITKRDEYERRGIEEYWVIDPANARVRAWRRERGRFIETLVEGDVLVSSAIAGFALDLRRLARAIAVERDDRV